MRKNFGPKPLCYPMPVYIIGTYNTDGTPNAMNAAWGGISEDQEITICVDSSHKTAENLLARKAFTVSMATAQMMTACDPTMRRNMSTSSIRLKRNRSR